MIKDTREISSNDVPPLSDLAKGGINVWYERRPGLAVTSHVSNGGDQAITTVTFLTRNDGLRYSTQALMSSCRLKTPSFSNSSTCFGGPQVCCVHTGADGPFAAVAQLGPRSL